MKIFGLIIERSTADRFYPLEAALSKYGSTESLGLRAAEINDGPMSPGIHAVQVGVTDPATSKPAIRLTADTAVSQAAGAEFLREHGIPVPESATLTRAYPIDRLLLSKYGFSMYRLSHALRQSQRDGMHPGIVYAAFADAPESIAVEYLPEFISADEVDAWFAAHFTR